MMHYNRPWIHHQQMLLEQHPYYQYALHEMQLHYSSSEHQEEDYEHGGDEIPSETSDDQNHNADMFRLAFAASQWSKLVLNAEGLFTKLMSTNALPPNEQHLLKNQIEQWLCMKQEYEECIAGDDSGSLQGYTENTRRSLERIEEVTETTETDEKTDESNNWIKSKNQKQSCSSTESDTFNSEDSDQSDQTDRSDESDTDYGNTDFLDKLDERMKKFNDDTDEILLLDKNDCLKSRDNTPELQLDADNNFVPTVKPISVRKPSSRRMSILPHSEMSNEIVEFQKQNSNINLQRNNNQDSISQNDLNCSEKNYNPEELCKNFEDSMKVIDKADHVIVDPEDINMIRTLRISIQEKQSEMKTIQFHLDHGYKQAEDLENTIKVKEQLIEDMLQSCDARNSAKQKFQEKRSKIEEKYRNVEKVLHYKRLEDESNHSTNNRQEIKEYENLLMIYEKKLEDIQKIKQLASNSTKTLSHFKNSLHESKKQMERLNQRLKQDEDHKRDLEDEVNRNKRKIREIEDKYQLTISKLRTVSFESEDGRNQNRLKKKEKNFSETHDCSLKSDAERAEEGDEKENLRQEIRSLRHFRDRIIDIKCNCTNGVMPVTVESQRQVLFISEFVETIDAMIEQKNVMICGKNGFNETKSKFDEQILSSKTMLSRLEKLSQKELVTLFYTYFNKVIDLKDSSKNLEIQNATLEETMKQLEREHEFRMSRLKKSYERKISLLLNYCAEEKNSSSCDTKLDRHHDFDRLVKENQSLRTRLAYFESLLKTPGTSSAPAIRSQSTNTTKPPLKSELLQIALPPTTVTRQGNKLIFERSKKRK